MEPQAPSCVLLFEDDEGQALLTKEALEKEGFAVDTAKTAHEGLNQLWERDYQIFLIDIKMPDIQGVEVLRRVIHVKPDAICLIVTGHGDEVAAVEAMKLGAYDYIVKSPYMGHLSALPLVIREAVEHQQLRKERERLQTELWEHAHLLEQRNAELRRINEELKRIDQLKSDLVSMVSHELRTPLATIKEFTAILEDQIAGPTTPEQQEYLTIIKGNVERLSRIIDDLLDMAKIEAGRVLLNKRFVEVRELIEQLIVSMRPLAESRQVELDTVLPSVSPGIFADSDKIAQVLTNLLSNAIKYTPGPGRVTVTVEEFPNEVQFSVTDTGVGIAPEDLPKLFEKFQQFRRIPGLEGSKGTGLGLAISKKLVELHGGRIWATSTLGSGSAFAFTLPKYHVDEIFKELLKDGIAQAKQKQVRFSIVVFGLVNFHQLKALYGLEETGRLLKDIEQVLQDTVRRVGDVVIRWQRGEMVVILAEVDKVGSVAIGERIKQIIESRTFLLGGTERTIQIVAGTATYPDDAMDEERLLTVAEERLQQTIKPKTRLLVIDDEPKIRKFLQEALELRDYEVLTAAGGPDALGQLAANSVDLILLDVIMPVMDGYEVYHHLKENPKTRDIPVILVTAKGERKDRILGFETPQYNYIAKPFQLEDLLAKIREALLQASDKP